MKFNHPFHDCSSFLAILIALLLFSASLPSLTGCTGGETTTSNLNADPGEGPTRDGMAPLPLDRLVDIVGLLPEGSSSSPSLAVPSMSTFAPAPISYDVPFLSQIPPGENSVDGWHTTRNCGPASLLMVSSYYQGTTWNQQTGEAALKDTVLRLRDRIPDYMPNGCSKNAYGAKQCLESGDFWYGAITNTENIATLARSYNFEAKHTTIRNKNSLAVELQHGPLIVALQTQMSMGGFKHFMVLTGMDIQNNKIWVNDPGRSWPNIGFAKNKEYSLDQFWTVFSSNGYAVVIVRPKGETLPPGLLIQALDLPHGVTGQQFSHSLVVVGGTAPYTWTVSGLPAGLLCSSGGNISGIQAATGTSQLTVRVVDSRGKNAESNTSLIVDASPAGSPPPPPPPGNVLLGYDDFLTIYRFVENSTAGRHYNDSLTPPTTNSRYERESFILARTALASAVSLSVCTRQTDSIILPTGAGDYSSLISAGYSCRLLGFGFTSATKPVLAPFPYYCPVRRCSYSATIGMGAHLYTTGQDSLAGMTSEGTPFYAFSNQVCQ